jgi:hypothetical protein
VSRPVARTFSLVAAVALAATVTGCGASGPGGTGDTPPGGTAPAGTPPDRPATVAPEADVGLDPIHTYPPATVTVDGRHPVTVEIPGTAGIIDRITTEAQRDPDAGVEAVVTIEFGAADRWPDYSLLVFVNTPDADADTATGAPGFTGSVAFPHGDPSGGDEPLRAILPATGAINRTAGTGLITVTLVPQARAPGSPTGQAIDVTVTLSLMRATPG